MTAYIIPCVIGLIFVYGLIKKVDVFSEFIIGAKEGVRTTFNIIPSLIALMTCVGAFKMSGGLDILSSFISPITSLLGIPEEVIPLGILRPISGSGALCLYENILSQNGADTYIGRVASVLMGSTETTFYAIAVYFGAVNVHKTKYTIISSSLADITSFILSAIIVRMLFI